MALNMKTKVNITQSEEEPIERNILAQAIVEMSSAMKKLTRGGLAREAIVILTQHNYRTTSKYPSRKPSLAEVRAVLDSLDELAGRYTRK